MPSGGRVRFKTDTTTLKLRIQHSRTEIAMPHMCAVGCSGIDLYAGPPRRMVYWASNKPIQAGPAYVSGYFEKLLRKLREFTLYLPTYNDLRLLEIGLDPDAVIEPPARFRLAKPVVFYGTSITQGGCASRPGMGYVPMLGRRLGVDVVNLGFSGNGQSDLEVADLIAEIDAACYVNDCVANMDAPGMTERYAAFNERLRARHPHTPLLLLTSIRWAAENFLGDERWDAANAIVQQTYRQFRKRGDRNVHFLDCRNSIGREADHPSVDGVHLTDLGYGQLAAGLAPVLGRIL
jgi:lysophospholipase L1-like esterase